MSIWRKWFGVKPPDGLLQIADRVYGDFFLFSLSPFDGSAR